MIIKMTPEEELEEWARDCEKEGDRMSSGLLRWALAEIKRLTMISEERREMLARYWASRLYPKDIGDTLNHYNQHSLDMGRLLANGDKAGD